MSKYCSPASRKNHAHHGIHGTLGWTKCRHDSTLCARNTPESLPLGAQKVLGAALTAVRYSFPNKRFNLSYQPTWILPIRADSCQFEMDVFARIVPKSCQNGPTGLHLAPHTAGCANCEALPNTRSWPRQVARHTGARSAS